MTVHAAKGLEAKIVFLPDTCATPTARLDPPVFDLAEDGEAPLLVWSPRGGDDPAPVADARKQQRAAAMREYRRLLYVAMTRADERLYLAGFYNVQKPPEDCWNAMIQAVFGTAEGVPAFWDEAEIVRRIRTPGTPVAGRGAARAARAGALTDAAAVAEPARRAGSGIRGAAARDPASPPRPRRSAAGRWPTAKRCTSCCRRCRASTRRTRGGGHGLPRRALGARARGRARRPRRRSARR